MSVKAVESLEQRRASLGTGAAETAGLVTEGFGDQYGINPRPGYSGYPTTTIDNYAGGRGLNTYGADIPSDTIEGTDVQYPYNYSYHTPAGHIVEYNDTPGSERIMIRHKSGTGINIGPDGSVMISSKRRVDVINENHYVSVAGNGTMTYEGNLTLNVTGNFNVNVGGEYNVVSAKTSSRTNGPYTRTVYGDDTTTVKGNQTCLVTGGGANTYLEGLNMIAKGESRFAVEGPLTIAASDTLSMTAESEVVITSNEANIAANNLSVFGATGTIGGEGLVAYVQNIFGSSGTFDAGVTAPTFHGDLNGLAKQAVTSGVTLSQSYADPVGGGGVGSNPGWSITDTATDTTASAKPTAALMTDYVSKGSRGAKRVKVDPDSIIKNNIDFSNKTGGVSDVPLSAALVRSKMRDPANRSNTEFLSTALASGALSPDYAKTTPPNVSSIQSTSSVVIQGQTPIGSPSLELTARKIRGV